MPTVEVVSYDASLRRITTDSRMEELLDLSLERPRMVWLLLAAVREYRKLEHLRRGAGGGAPGLAGLIAAQSFDRRDRAKADRIRLLLERLYEEFDEGQVRGAIVEALAEQQIRSRYAAAESLCTNNAILELANGVSHTTTTSVDVVGWDASVGECHDCKADAVGFDAAWIGELESDVAPFGMAIALVTADSQDTAMRKLKRGGIRLKVAQLIAQENLFARLPLR